MIRSIAQQCLEADDPLAKARANTGYMGHPSKDVLRFHFEDNSCLDFQMTTRRLRLAGFLRMGGREINCEYS